MRVKVVNFENPLVGNVDRWAGLSELTLLILEYQKLLVGGGYSGGVWL